MYHDPFAVRQPAQSFFDGVLSSGAAGADGDDLAPAFLFRQLPSLAEASWGKDYDHIVDQGALLERCHGLRQKRFAVQRGEDLICSAHAAAHAGSDDDRPDSTALSFH
jgi:hypothetical protein